MIEVQRFISGSGEIGFYDTPWNSRVIGGNTLEIKYLNYTGESGFELLDDFCRIKREEGYKLLAARIPGTSMELKRAYLESGFRIVEHTLDVTSTKLDIERLEAFAKRFPVDLDYFRPEDITQIQEIAGSVFRYGRFFEDPFIEFKTAQERNRLWIQNLIEQGAKIAISRKENVVIGFIAYLVENQKVNLVLGGVRSEYRLFSYSFWSKVLLTLKSYSEIWGLLSSNNINTINLYVNLGFRFTNPQFGFHMHF